MRHSNFETIRRAMRNTEEKEFIEAVKAHGGKYTFITEEQINKATEDDEYWEEDVPTVSTWHIDDEDTLDVLVTSVEYYEINEMIYNIDIHGILYRSRERISCPMYSLLDGNLHSMMDFMSEPLGSDK